MGQVFKPKFFYEYIDSDGNIIMDKPLNKNESIIGNLNSNELPSRVKYYYD